MANHNFDTEPKTIQDTDNENMECRLYVDNLPPELNKDGITEIFAQYGQITGMFYRDNAKWAYITYGTYREAEYVIRELNDKKPLYIKVTFAKERPVLQQDLEPSFELEPWQTNRSNGNAATELESPNYNEKHPSLRNMGRGQLLGIHENLEKFRETSSKSSQFPCLNSHGSNMYEDEEPITNTNKLWSRGTITVTADGKRHVSLGRGYTLYEFPENTPKMQDYITKVCERRNIGLYEYGEDKLNDETQKCRVCFNKTTKHCEKCYVYYCSRTCQVTDWPRHQIECQRIPALVDETIANLSLLQINKNGHQIQKLDTTSHLTASNDMKLRRPKTPLRNASTMNAYNDMINDVNVTSNSINNKTDNDTNTPQTKKIYQSAGNTMYTKDFSQQNKSHAYVHIYINDNISAWKKVYTRSSAVTSNFNDQSYNTCNYSVNVANTCVYNPTKEIISDNNNGSKSPGNSKSQFKQTKEFHNGKATALPNNEEMNNKEDNFFNDVTMDENSTINNLYLSKIKFTEVEVTVPLDHDEYWVCKVEDLGVRANLMGRLQKVAIESRSVQPIIGNIYAVIHKTIWHRAMVISLGPIKVHLIDFGNDKLLEKDAELKDIHDLCKIPKFTRKICLTQTPSKKYNNLTCGDRIFVKMLSVNAERTIMVKVEEQPKDSGLNSLTSILESNNTKSSVQKHHLEDSNMSNTNTKAIQLPSVLDAIANLSKSEEQLNLPGIIRINKIIQKNVYSATLFPHVFSAKIEQILYDLPVECEKMKNSVDYKACVGDLVCCETEDGDWYRGYVLTLSPNLSIAMIDQSKIMSVNKILPYPKEFLDICTFGVTCEITTNELEAGNVYHFTAVINKNKQEQESIKIEIKKKEDTLIATIKSWKAVKPLAPTFAELKSGSKICLTSYRSQYVMFARSLDDAEIEYYNNTMQRVAQYAQTALHLSAPPNTGEMVIAPYCDGNNYRAFVIKVQDDEATIAYTDFGNVENINIKKLQVLSNDLGAQRSNVVKITLKDVPHDMPMTKDVDEYLRDLVGQEVSLICTYDGISFKDGVYLKTSTGESVNDKINLLLKPSWKQDDYNDQICFMMQDIEVANLGRVGDTVDALVLLIPQDGLKYMMCPVDMDLMTYVFEIMPGMLKEYCEKTEYYIPRAQELCIALYEGAWYRALCITPRESSTTCQIFFVDYGNMESVEYKNIRLMPKDYITPAAIANMCTVVNLAPTDSTGNYSPAIKKKISELVRTETIIKIKIVDCYEIGAYNIELPAIHKALIEENLIQ